MKNYQKLLFSILLTITLAPAYGQSKKEMESYLSKEWVSAAVTYETGDTIQELNEMINLSKKGKMTTKMNGIDHSGTWKYMEDTRQLQVIINVEDRSIDVLLDIGKSSNQVLALTRKNKNGITFITTIFVEKGSGLIFETVKVPELSFDEIMEQSKANENSDLGYSPAGEVLKRYDFNFNKSISYNGSSSSGGVGIVYLLKNENGKKVVIIYGQNAMPEEWDVVSEEEINGEITYKCNLYFDYERGKKIEVDEKAKFIFNESKVFMVTESSIEFSNQ